MILNKNAVIFPTKHPQLLLVGPNFLLINSKYRIMFIFCISTLSTKGIVFFDVLNQILSNGQDQVSWCGFV